MFMMQRSCPKERGVALLRQPQAFADVGNEQDGAPDGHELGVVSDEDVVPAFAGAGIPDH